MKDYVSKLYVLLDSKRNPDVSIAQSQYMRNRFPFFGIKNGPLIRFWMDFQRHHGKVEIDDIKEFVELCMNYKERELWYIASNLLKKNSTKLNEGHLSLVKEIIVQSDWWDIVDVMAVHPIGSLYLKYLNLRCQIDDWIDHENYWLRRTAILYQLRYKEETNEDILYSHILKVCHEEEFFIRKAIGWALREYSKTNREFVRDFINSNKSKLSNLSIREGLKYL